MSIYICECHLMSNSDIHVRKVATPATRAGEKQRAEGYFPALYQGVTAESSGPRTPIAHDVPHEQTGLPPHVGRRRTDSSSAPRWPRFAGLTAERLLKTKTSERRSEASTASRPTTSTSRAATTACRRRPCSRRSSPKCARPITRRPTICEPPRSPTRRCSRPARRPGRLPAGRQSARRTPD
jgi:hypothetical protein